MHVLGVDAATPIASVGLIHDGRVLAETTGTAAHHVESLLPLIRGVLDRAHADLTDLDGIGLTIGPGSFSGLRVALGTVKGLAYARSLRVAGVSTLSALAHAVPDWTGRVGVVLDARKREVYVAFFDRAVDGCVTRLTQDAVLAPDVLPAEGAAPCLFVGDGAERYADILRGRYGDATRLLPLARVQPRASIVARLAWARFRRGEADDAAQLVPHYLRRPDAERNRAAHAPTNDTPDRRG